MKLKLCIFLSVCLANLSRAQKSDMDFVFTHPVFQNYSMKNGLSSNYCSDVLQDKHGFIWVATLNGLNRFNGNEWKSYQQQSPEARYRLAGNWVIDLDEGKDSVLWINTDRGIARYDKALDSIISYAYPVKGWGKLASANGNIFVSSWSGVEVFRLQQDSLVSQKYYPETQKNSFPHLFYGADGHVWACPEDNPSLIKIHAATQKIDYYKTLSINGSRQDMVLNSFSDYAKDTLLLNTKSFGVLKYSITHAKAIPFINPHLISNDEVSCSVVYVLNGCHFLFVGTKKSGLYAMNLQTGELNHYVHDHNDPGSIASNNITAVFSDNNKGVWIATTKGLSFFHPSLQKNKFYFFYNNAAIPAGVLINAVYKTGAGEFLIGTDNYGLFLFNEFTKATTRISNSEKLRISSFCEDGEGAVLVGTNKGLYNYDIASHTFQKKSIGGNSFDFFVLRVKMLSGKKVALCTTSGLLVYHLKDEKLVYSEIDMSKADDERNICKDAFLDGNHLWILRFFNGYELYDLVTGKHNDCTPKELLHKPVDYHNVSAGYNKLYISSSAGIIVQSLTELNNARVLKTAAGLNGDQIENVCLLNNEQLYYTTPEGLYCYSPTKQKSSRVAGYENYTQKWFNQLELLKDSMLLYTVSDYFMVSKPFLDFKNTRTPTVDIEQVLVNGKPYVLKDKEVSLEYHQNNISIYLAGLVYPGSEKNTWYYRLNAPDTFLRCTTTGEIQLTHLPPDRYQLQIYSMNNEGLLSPVSKVLTITIQEPFYKTWWFYMLIGFGVTAVVSLLYLYRLKQQMHLVKIRNQISRDLHDELGANVSSIHIMAKMLLNKEKKDVDPVLANISKYSVQISDTINDIIWNVNPKFDSVEELIKKMIRYASETLDAAKIHYTVEVPKKSSSVELDNQFKYHLYLMFKEIMNNVAKHSEATQAAISINIEANVFSFKVVDNGKGFHIEDSDKGNGLYNLRSRARDIGAVLHMQSTPGQGTMMELTVKLK